MAQRKDPVADAIARIASLRNVDDRPGLADGLTKLLGERSSYVIGRAAELAGERGVRDVVPALVTALERTLRDPRSDDVGSAAAHALVRALVTLEAGYEAEEVALRATRHTRWESVYGGAVDVAVAVRGNACILLAAMGSTQALRAASELLAEADLQQPRERTSWPARADAAKALAMIGSDGAAAVLRFKLLIGDAEPNVLSDCLAGLLAIERDAALPLAERMLTSDDDPAHAEAALLALGGWRDARAFGVIKSHESRFLPAPAARELYLASVAMTRRPEGIDYLFELATSGPRDVRPAAVAALEPLRAMPAVAARLDAMSGEAKPSDRKRR
jgi:HEAT repeat protein